MRSIRDDEVEIWFTRVDAYLTLHTERRLIESLSEEERRRVGRAVHDHLRRERLASYALVRHGLSRYTDAPPESWAFVTNAFGRPELSPGSRGGEMRFNVSHSHGMICCAFARGREVGVDIEDANRSVPELDTMSHCLSVPERTHLATLPGNGRAEVFYRYWTLKEAFAKAHGVGLSLGLERFTVTLDPAGPSIDPLSEEDAWQFAQVMVSSSYVLSAAVRRLGDETITFTIRDACELNGA